MRAVGFLWAFFATVRAICEGTTCWIPKSGEIVQEAADALGVDIETFKKWNPKLKPDEIYTTDVLAVSSVGPLSGAVWLTRDSTRFLHLGEASGPGHETSIASGTWGSVTSNEGATTPKTTLTASPSSGPATEDESTATPRASTVSAEISRPTPPCGGAVDGLPLLCNARNDGTFFTNGENIKPLIKNFCSDYGGSECTSGSGAYVEIKQDPEKPSISYQVYVESLPGCKPSRRQVLYTGQECRDLMYRNFDLCHCNGGTGAITIDMETCISWSFRPLLTEVDSSGYYTVPDGFKSKWGADYVEDFVEGNLHGLEYGI